MSRTLDLEAAPLLYLVFAIVVTTLYGACRWFASVKARHPGGWLRYL